MNSKSIHTTGLAFDGAASDNQDETCIQMIHNLWSAWSNKDTVALEALLAEDYIEFSGSTTRTIGKANVIKAAQQFFQNNSINDWSIQEVMVQHCGDVAVCSYYWSDSVTIKGKDASFAGATTAVLVKQNETWKYIHHHETFIRNSD